MEIINIININEYFINLINLAKEDESIKKQLLLILRLDYIKRKSIILEITTNMRDKNEPEELIEAFLCLIDNIIADRALKIISGLE